MSRQFPCNKCGQCCRNVHLAVETRPLDRGDGCCVHLDTSSNECTIYDSRPDICRVDVQYQTNYQHQYSWDEFVSLNVQVCDYLNSIKKE
ncbi:MAG TPA: zinc/iron-chelating domain-containing protein [Rheinheimera sp.]|nr:zinc/iron-chelating domain-containing protein [Rheinheimera sp.]